MSRKQGTPARRILAAFGEPDEFLGFTLGDLKLLIPVLFSGLIIAGNTPAVLQPAGYVAGGGLVLVCLFVIYATPSHQTTSEWLHDRVEFATAPARFVRGGGPEASDDPRQLHPAVEEEDTATDSGPIGAVVRHTAPGDSTSLTGLRRFLPGDAGHRTDATLYGAVEVTPANMALATDADWERAVEGFATAVNSIEFSFQIYSTVTPVDPASITDGYRERLGDGDLDETPAFRDLVATYAQQFPREFGRRGTGTRRYYIIVPVGPRDGRSAGSRSEHDGLLAQLQDLAYVGGFIRTVTAFHAAESAAERRHFQRTELDRRLEAITHGLRGIDGCSTRRLETGELASLLSTFWSGDSEPSTAEPTPRMAPLITTEQESPR